MREYAYREVLNRVGRVLVIVGLVDIAIMIYCIATSQSYSSSLNIFAVAAGIFLQRGSMRTARIVRLFAIFFGVALIGVMLAMPAIEPTDLLLARIRQQPGAMAMIVLAGGLLACLFLWVASQLGRHEVRAAVEEDGRRWIAGVIPALAAVLVIPAALAFSHALRHGEDAKRLVEMARRQAGEGYSYHLSSFSAAYSGDHSTVRGVVVAWNEQGIRELEVGWDE